MATNVLLRYGFSFGSVWAQELEWHLLAPLILFGMSYAMLHGEHVRVDVLYANFGERQKLWIEVLSQLICILVSVAIIWFSVKYVQQAYVIDERSPDPGGLTHRWVLKALIPLGFALLIAQCFASLLAALEKLRS